MFSKVRVNKNALDYFRRKAREASPLEIEAYLTGRVLSLNEIEILNFHYPDSYLEQSKEHVQWSTEQMDALKVKADNLNLRILGSIHSHPNWDAVMSSTDYQAYVLDQLPICGICSVNENKRTRVRFWTPTSALNLKIIYT